MEQKKSTNLTIIQKLNLSRLKNIQFSKMMKTTETDKKLALQKTAGMSIWLSNNAMNSKKFE